MEDQLRAFRRYSRVFPSVPYGRHAARVGCSLAANVKSAVPTQFSKVHHSVSHVKILALLCSKSAPHCEATHLPTESVSSTRKRQRNEEDDDKEDSEHPVAERSSPKTADDPLLADGDAQDSNRAAPQPSPSQPATTSATIADSAEARLSQKGHVYVRVQYDRALITTLPIEVMRKQHPQVLIDYLLSMSVWE